MRNFSLMGFYLIFFFFFWTSQRFSRQILHLVIYFFLSDNTFVRLGIVSDNIPISSHRRAPLEFVMIYCLLVFSIYVNWITLHLISFELANSSTVAPVRITAGYFSITPLVVLISGCYRKGELPDILILTRYEAIKRRLFK